MTACLLLQHFLESSASALIHLSNKHAYGAAARLRGSLSGGRGATLERKRMRPFSGNRFRHYRLPTSQPSGERHDTHRRQAAGGHWTAQGRVRRLQ